MSVSATVVGEAAPGTVRRHGPLPWPWRSPAGQPRWARPALLAVATAAATVYAWGIAHDQLHVFYSPAVKSMSESWKAWLYGGFDPAASITLDKLPGAFMVEALSARVFGFHVWSVILPQVVEAVITVLVLYRAVRRWRGPVAGLLAAVAFASTPIVAALARAEISDTLLVMLLVLAADGWTRAVSTGRLCALMRCGVWVGLAFQAKMVQAWAVVPALALVYLVAAPVTGRRRLVHAGLFGATAVAVSFVWIGLVLATPVADRPYIDGSLDNNPLAMVFEYNGLGRFGVSSQSAVTFGPAGPATDRATDWHFMVGGAVASQVGWLYPMALAGLVAGVVARGRAPRTDPVRAGFLMWALWLAAHVAAFTVGHVAHTYYVVAVAPAVAALFGGGLVSLWSGYRSGGARRWLLPAAAAATLAWIAYLAHQFAGFLPWSAPVAVGAGALGTATLAGAALPDGWVRRSARRILPALPGQRGGRSRLPRAGLAVAVVAMLLVPAAWTVSTVDGGDAGNAASPAAGPVAGMGFGGFGRTASARNGSGGGGTVRGGLGGGGFRRGGFHGNGFDGNGFGGSGGNGSVRGGFGRGGFEGNTFGGDGFGRGGGLAGDETRDGGTGPAGNRGPFGGGFFGTTGRPSAQTISLVAYLRAHHPGSRYLLAAQGSTTAGQFVLAGVSVLPMGGFTGTVPFPTVDQLAALVSGGQVRYVLTGGGPGGFGGRTRPGTTAAAVQSWVAGHCRAVAPSAYGGRTATGRAAQNLYDCAG